MDSINKNILKDNIKNYFENFSYKQKYNFDIWITIFAIVFVLYIIVYLYIKSSIKLNKINWEKNKCNPLYMPLAQLVNNGNKNFNKVNFSNCLNDIISNVGYDVMTPINAILNQLLIFYKTIADNFSQMSLYFTILFRILLNLYNELKKRLHIIAYENNIIFSKINNFIQLFLSFFTIMYYNVVILVDSIKLIFPMMALSFLVAIVLPAFIALFTAGLTLLVFWIIAHIPIIGTWAWASVAVWLVIVIFLTIYFIFISTLYILFANMCSDILEKTLKPISNINDYKMTFKKLPGT